MPCCCTIFLAENSSLTFDSRHAWRICTKTLLNSAAWVRCRRHVGIRAREIAAARAHLVALMVGHFDADFVVPAIDNVIRRKISDRILVAQLVADVLERLVQIIDMRRKKTARAPFISQLLEVLVATC